MCARSHCYIHLADRPVGSALVYNVAPFATPSPNLGDCLLLMLLSDRWVRVLAAPVLQVADYGGVRSRLTDVEPLSLERCL